MVVKIAIIKMGNIGTSPILDLILDERADREDIDVRTISSGAKMGKAQLDVLDYVKENDFDLILFISPNPSIGGPKSAREILAEIDIPTVIIGDQPGERAISQIKEQNLGYIIIKADPMIGARREFLDATEMAIFNADIMRVLAITGVFRLIHTTIDDMVEEIKNNKNVTLPELIVTSENATDAAEFKNPYAKSKAIAAYNIASKVAEMDVEACFKVKDPEKYIPMVCGAHEMMATAAQLAQQARDIEKSNDVLFRSSHKRNGDVEVKHHLMD
ncbi:MAG: F420-dependent methylenetetrahydromethanopterin dehydrogenase [Methanosphaera sp.]|uniref:F420-dependent methylenetetrahydromethanopterin dehydrogenase n=1 Tax=Methanosphaera sp. TaxID=2666342 RepID=UPI0025FC38BA|nr:F420-dependent methylenetetrahydromethanopterin dehydrogenase [Methanosphaera sp.]MCI5867614.1 F420-dependent methylenetetrahydromethanopterin dehydrogenase [Methanosphaera sp.]MDD6534081.1 F420-dependent methylenetetrahydromethanopterin dehydrogenase [Methanosphaera sp.]MDY3956109.1 F420-dependent methylenetetrahydromethanopterin dehydrogenase [Methanosphaera sp.]